MLLSIPIVEDVAKDWKPSWNKNHVGDPSDRLHYFYTVFILCLFAALTGAKQDIGDPIHCMIPQHMDKVKPWQAYVKQYCFATGTFRYDKKFATESPNTAMEQAIDPSDESYAPLTYYQWVPFIFVVQVFFFLMPHLLWKWMQTLFAHDLRGIVKDAVDCSCECNLAKRAESMKQLSDYLYENLASFSEHKSHYWCGCLSQPPLATAGYIFVKFAQLLNTLLIYYGLAAFLGFSDPHWGVPILRSYWNNSSSAAQTHFPYFPTEVVCAFKQVELDNVFNHSVQCILPTNYIIEKLFLIFWMWLIVLMIVSTTSFLDLSVSLLSPSSRFRVLLRYMPAVVGSPDHAFFEYQEFGSEFLGMDGMLMFRFLESSAGTVATRQIMRELWMRYYLEHIACRTTVTSGPESICSYDTVDREPPCYDYDDVLEADDIQFYKEKRFD